MDADLLSDPQAEADPLADSLADPSSEPAAPTQRAYVLEDDSTIAALEADLLRDLGFGVVTCSRIVELGDLMEVSLPHLLVADVTLPDGDGGDIAHLLRNLWPGIPVVLVTAAGRDRLDGLADLGPVVQKPFDCEGFCAAVLEAMEQPHAVLPAATRPRRVS